MASMETIKKMIYDVPSEEGILLLTTFRVAINAIGADGYLQEESKRISLKENILQSKEDLMQATRRVSRNIHELVLLTKEGRNWWLFDSRDACKVFWRIDHFLNIERNYGFGVVNPRKLEDYQTLGAIAQRMLDVMTHREATLSKNCIIIPDQISDEQRSLDNLMRGLDMVTADAATTVEVSPTPTYRNPFASELLKANINLHDVFRI